jgi:hypothetical protein
MNPMRSALYPSLFTFSLLTYYALFAMLALWNSKTIPLGPYAPCAMPYSFNPQPITLEE